MPKPWTTISREDRMIPIAPSLGRDVYNAALRCLLEHGMTQEAKDLQEELRLFMLQVVDKYVNVRGTGYVPEEKPWPALDYPDPDM